MSPEKCWHPSMDGIDQTPILDPSKRWRCMSCGIIGTEAELYPTKEN